MDKKEDSFLLIKREYFMINKNSFINHKNENNHQFIKKSFY